MHLQKKCGEKSQPIVKNMKTLCVHERKRVFILNSRKW